MIRILVVDDEYSIREALRDLLSDEGYAVELAASGAEAMQQLRSGERPHLALVDVMMPRMDGRAVLREIREDPELGGLPVILMTAAPMVIAPAERLGAPLLRKPIDVDELLRLIAKLVAA